MSVSDSKEIATQVTAGCLCFRARCLSRTVSRLYHEGLRPHGVTVAQFILLAAITRRAPVMPAELSKRLNLEKSTLSRNIKLMEAGGWVSVGQGRSARAQQLSITTKGRNALERAFPAWKRAQETARELLGDDIIAALKRVRA